MRIKRVYILIVCSPLLRLKIYLQEATPVFLNIQTKKISAFIYLFLNPIISHKINPGKKRGNY